MDFHASDQQHFALKVVDVDYCENCVRRFKNRLLTIAGVHSVSIDPKEKLVYVKGQIDPLPLIKMIAKMGKLAELVTKNVGHVDEFPSNNTQNVQQEYPKTKKDKAPMDNDCSCHGNFNMHGDNVWPTCPPTSGIGHQHHESKEECLKTKKKSCHDDFHKLPPLTSRDRDHIHEFEEWCNRKHSMRGDKFPMFGHHPHAASEHFGSSHYPECPPRVSHCNKWPREERPLYDRYPPTMAPVQQPRTYSYQGFSMSDLDSLTHHFNDDNPFACSIM